MSRTIRLPVWDAGERIAPIQHEEQAADRLEKWL